MNFETRLKVLYKAKQEIQKLEAEQAKKRKALASALASINFANRKRGIIELEREIKKRQKALIESI